MFVIIKSEIKMTCFSIGYIQPPGINYYGLPELSFHIHVIYNVCRKPATAIGGLRVYAQLAFLHPWSRRESNPRPNTSIQ
jgi:hypothetical protein